MKRFISNKTRQSTKDRFVSVLHGDLDPNRAQTPWYKRSTNMFPLIMIVVFSFLYLAASVYTTARRELGQESKEESITYDEAKDIFNSSVSIPDDEEANTTN